MQRSTHGRSADADRNAAEQRTPRWLNYDFGPFTLRTRDSVLLRDGEVVPMRHKVLETLRVLVEQHGHFISRTELLDKVWSGEFVEESSITQNISQLRRVLDPAFPDVKPIETRSKKGYRFAVPVTVREAEPTAHPIAPTGPVFHAQVAGSTETSSPNHRNMVGQILVFAPSRLADAVMARDLEQKPPRFEEPPSPQMEREQGGTSDQASANDVEELAEPEIAGSAPAPAMLLAAEASALVDVNRKPVSPRAFRGRLMWSTAAAVCVCLLLGAMWLVRRHTRSVTAARRSVAILSMTNLNGDPQQEWVGTAVSEMVSAGLLANSSLSVISGAPVARMHHDLGLPATLSTTQETAGKICSYLSCTHVVTGSYLLQKDRIWLDMKLQDAASGQILTAVSLTGREADLNQLVSSIAAQLRGKLGLDASRPEQSLAINDAGLRAYSMGLQSLEADNLSAAYALFVQATHDAPKSALPAAALARTWSLMGYEEEASKVAQKAVLLSGPLPKEQQNSILAFSRKTSRDWPAAIQLYTRLHQSRPRDVQALLDLAEVLRASGQSAAAVRLLTGSEMLQDQQVQLELANAKLDLADYPGTLDAAQNAEHLAQSRGAESAAAEAQLLQAYARGRHGEVSQAIAQLGKVLSRVQASGNQRLQGRALRYQGTFLRQAGDLEKARTQFEEALHLAEALGDRPATIDSLVGLGNVLRNMDQMNAAKIDFERGLDIAKEIGDKRREATMLVNVANTTNNMGDPDTALKLQEDGLRLAEEVQDHHTVMNLHGNMGVILSHQGNLTRGVPLLEDAVREAKELNEPHMEAYYEGHLASADHLQGKGAAALQAAEHSCAIFHALKEVRYEAGCALQLASFYMEEGRCAEADKLDAPLLTSQNPEMGTRVWKTQAECHLRAGRLADARVAGANSARFASQTLNSEDFIIPSGLVNARIKIASGKSVEAERLLVQLVSQAHGLHLLPLELDCRLLLAEIHQRAGVASAARELQGVADDAKKSGLFLFQQRANRDANVSL